MIIYVYHKSNSPKPILSKLYEYTYSFFLVVLLVHHVILGQYNFIFSYNRENMVRKFLPVYRKKTDYEKNDMIRLCCNNRSEEHTSELQSRFDLVCRLLLEKKKNKTITYKKSQSTPAKHSTI